MTKEVLIHLKGMQTTDDPHGSDEPLELITVGEYYYRNNTHYLLYEEQMEGLDEPIHNLVKIRPGHMEVRKKRDLSNRERTFCASDTGTIRKVTGKPAEKYGKR